MDYKNKIAKLIKKYVDLEIEIIEMAIEIPLKSEFGDFTFRCFQLSKFIRKSPDLIAKELKEYINTDEFEKIINVGPYLNFFIHKGEIVENIIKKVLKERDYYGSSNIGSGKTICIEYLPQSIVRPLHIGHLFSITIGSALYKMFKKEGYNTIGINQFRDWGIPLGVILYAYDRWGDNECLEKAPFDELLRIYSKFHKCKEEDSNIEENAREYFKALENGNKIVADNWNKIRNLSLNEFKRIYCALGVEFDYLVGESVYSYKINTVLNELREKRLVVKSNGAQVVMLEEYNMPPFIVSRDELEPTDSLMDLVGIVYRQEIYNFDKCVYISGFSQELYFKQLFKVLELLEKDWVKESLYLKFGLIKFIDRKYLTRNGCTISLNNLLSEAYDEAVEIINKKKLQFKNKKEAAKKISISALIFNLLKNSWKNDMIFDWKEIFTFEEDGWLYIFDLYSKGNNMLRGVKKCDEKINYKKLSSKEEIKLVNIIGNFNEAIRLALDKLDTSSLTRYVIEVAKALNSLIYNGNYILNLDDEDLKEARLNLIRATLHVIKNGLCLVGADIIEEA